MDKVESLEEITEIFVVEETIPCPHCQHQIRDILKLVDIPIYDLKLKITNWQHVVSCPNCHEFIVIFGAKEVSKR